MHAGYSTAHLEPKASVVAQRLGHQEEVFGVDVQGHLRAVDDDPGDRSVVFVSEGILEMVGDLVEVTAERPLRRPRRQDRLHQSAVSRGVKAKRPAEHPMALAHLDRSRTFRVHRADGTRPRLLGLCAADVLLVTRRRGIHPIDSVFTIADGVFVARHHSGLNLRYGVLLGLVLAHASKPFISWVGVAFIAAASAARAAATRSTPNFEARICSCNSNRALISICGRGGQPGR